MKHYTLHRDDTVKVLPGVVAFRIGGRADGKPAWLANFGAPEHTDSWAISIDGQHWQGQYGDIEAALAALEAM